MKSKKTKSGHSESELAEATIFPVALTTRQQKEAKEQLANARVKNAEEMTENDRLSLQLLQLKFQVEDYIQNKEFNPELTFGYFLKQYVDLFRVKRKDFADEISIDTALLSQFINEHRMPPDYIAIRLEIHSNNAIPATYWVKLVEKQKEFALNTDLEIRKREKKFVRRRLTINPLV